MRRSITSMTLATAAVLMGAGLTAVAATPAADPTADTRPQVREHAREGGRGYGRDGGGENMRGRMGRGDRALEIDRHLTPEQVRDIVAGRLAMSGNTNLKVGKVTAKEEGVISVEIVTKTGALVDTNEISTKSGRPVAMEKMRAAFRDHRGPGGRGGLGVRDAQKDLKLTVDQVRKLAEAQLIRRGNPNLKVGQVKEKDADTITVDIVASDNSLVSQREVDRHTGRPKRNRA